MRTHVNRATVPVLKRRSSGSGRVVARFGASGWQMTAISAYGRSFLYGGIRLR
jgi:hypothetical protein